MIYAQAFVGNTIRAFVAGSAEARAATERGVKTGSILLAKRLRDRFTGAKTGGGFWGPGSPAGAFLGVRTGQTRARLSPGGVTLRSGDTVTAAVGSPDPYVKAQEDGGTFTAGGFFRIPTAAAQTGAGADINAGRSVRGLPGYRLIRTSAGKLWIVRDAGGPKSGRVEFMYLLAKTIHLRGRHIFAETQAEMQPVIADLFNAEAGAVVSTVNRG